MIRGLKGLGVFGAGLVLVEKLRQMDEQKRLLGLM